MNMFRLRIVCFLMRMICKLWPRSGNMACANRRVLTTVIGHVEYTLTSRDTTKEDGYARDEVYQMLRWVRRMENRSQTTPHSWKCPEPGYYEIALSGDWNQPQRLGDKR